jgi:hypothetical protein
MTKAILSAGAKFGPNEKGKALQRFPLGELEPILGKISVVSLRTTFSGFAFAR